MRGSRQQLKWRGGSGSSSNSSTSTSSGSLNGLKFDKKSYFGESSPPAEAKRPPLAPGKKGGVVVQGGQRCQVEGCEFDLRSVKGYYYRHRVCGIHSKSAKVIVNGVEQRFCQQCSRFHLVPEFDKGKRSCRRRLACHNQRRRKPPSDGNGTLFSCNGTSKSASSSSKAGSFMLDFSVQPPVLTGSGDSHSNPYAETDAYPWHRNPPEIATRSNIFGSQECLTGVSDCSRALSLLSTQNWDSRHQSSMHDEGVINALVTTPPMMVQVLQPSDSSHNEEESIHGLSNTLCRRSLKARETNSHMSTEVGLIETSQPAGNHYHYHGHVDDMVQQNERGFVGLFEQSVEYDSDSSLPEHSRGYGYDSFLQNMVL